MDDAEAYKWGDLFDSDWESLVNGMAARAQTLGLSQQIEHDALVWSSEDDEQCRWLFLPDPSDIQRVRSIFANDRHVNSPACYIVVRQPDPSDDRGDVIFDIFRIDSESCLWHFNRVFTSPKHAV